MVPLIKGNVKDLLLKAVPENFFSEATTFSSILFFLSYLLNCCLWDPKYLLNQLNQLTKFPSIRVPSAFRYPVTAFWEGWIPFETEAIVFCRQILSRIFWDSLRCYCSVPEKLPAYELQGIHSCPNEKVFSKLYFSFFLPSLSFMRPWITHALKELWMN